MKKLIHPITKDIAIYDEYYNSWCVSDGNGGYYSYSEATILAYGFVKDE